jgi:hypothetical protein
MFDYFLFALFGFLNLLNTPLWYFSLVFIFWPLYTLRCFRRYWISLLSLPRTVGDYFF